jgi:hypothetical protein
MNTTTTHSRIGIALVALTGALVLAACSTGAEGDRCNPDLSHDECNSGLSCQQPVNCPENYCCPVSGPASNPYCQPGCNGGQAAICAAGGDAECWQLDEAGSDAPMCDASAD